MEGRVADFGHEQPIIGVVHLRPLPGSPGYKGDPQQIVTQALSDAAALVEGGVDSIMIENFGDTPYFPDHVPPETIAWMARIGGLIRDAHRLPIGVCVLRNDGRAALAVAQAIEAQFIRVCILASPRVTDQGVLQGEAHMILRDRARLGADVKILADVDIKHSYPLSPTYSLSADAADLVSRSKADALIVTGPATGVEIAESHLAELRSKMTTPVFVGSGVTHHNIKTLATHASGFIVGTSLKSSSRADAPVSVSKVRDVVDALRG